MEISKDNGLIETKKNNNCGDRQAFNEGESNSCELSAEQREWLSDEFWERPKWLTSQLQKASEKLGTITEFRNYKACFEYNLQSRYLELEGEFRTVLSNNRSCRDLKRPTASRIVSLLKTAKSALESEKIELVSIADVLDLVERAMIWLYTPALVEQRIKSLSDRIIATKPNASAMLNKIITDCPDLATIDIYRDAYDRVTSEINRDNISNFINYGLQLKRLSILRLWGLIVLATIITISPFILSFTHKNVDPNQFPSNFSYSSESYLRGILMFFTLSFLGAVGGFLSGLLQIKRSRTNLIHYRESVLRFHLRPIVGGITAALISILLLRKVFPSIVIDDIGMLASICIISGFSERFFLKLMNVEEENLTTKEKQAKTV